MQTELNYTEKEQLNEDHPVLPVEETHPEVSPERPKANDTLVFLDERRKKKVDVTIDTPAKYLSRYHYDTKNLDKYLELCPHCRKPTLSSYRRTVADSALVYLEEKEDQKSRRSFRRMLAGITASVMVISAGLYFVVFHLLSGVRF